MLLPLRDRLASGQRPERLFTVLMALRVGYTAASADRPAVTPATAASGCPCCLGNARSGA